MAGYGPAPKEPSRRARRNKDEVSTTRLQFQRGQAPDLPGEIDWHPRTRTWWRVWQESSLSELMSAVDWEDMLDTALLHHQYWANGHWTLAAEIRLRVARFGGTPADRLRLRIQWADADQKDADVPQTGPVPERYAQLRVLPMPSAGGSETGGNEE